MIITFMVGVEEDMADGQDMADGEDGADGADGMVDLQLQHRTPVLMGLDSTSMYVSSSSALRSYLLTFVLYSD